MMDPLSLNLSSAHRLIAVCDCCLELCMLSDCLCGWVYGHARDVLGLHAYGNLARSIQYECATVMAYG